MKNKVLKQLLVVSLFPIIATGEINLLTSDAHSLSTIKLREEQESKYKEILEKVDSFVNKNIDIKSNDSGLPGEYWAKRAITQKNNFSLFENKKDDKKPDFSESIKNLKKLVAYSYVYDDAQQKHCVENFFEQIGTAMKSILLKRNVKENEDLLLGLINGWMVFESLCINWCKTESGDVSGVKINFDSDENRAYLKLNTFFESIFIKGVPYDSSDGLGVAQVDGRFTSLFNMLKEIKYNECNGEQKLNSIIQRRSKSLSLQEYFKHDWDCYLTQFWVICDGLTKENKKIASVASKIVNDEFAKNYKHSSIVNKSTNNNKNNIIQDEIKTKNNIIPGKVKYANNKINNNNFSNNNFSNNNHNYSNNSQANFDNNNISNVNNINNINNMNNSVNNNVVNNRQVGQKMKKVDLTGKLPISGGLDNIGSTCYMNSILQCLAHTTGLANYLLAQLDPNYLKNSFTIENGEVKIKTDVQKKIDFTCVGKFSEVLIGLWAPYITGTNLTKYKHFAPNNFRDWLVTANPDVFVKGEASDSKDLIIFLLEQMHNELKKPVPKEKQIKKVEEPLNQYDQKNAFQHFCDELQKDTSIITDLFFGFNETTNTCLNCKKFYNSRGMKNPICYNYGIFNCLIFPLEEVRKMVIDYCRKTNPSYSTNTVTLEQCFIYNQKTDFFTGDNKNYCNICKQLSDSEYTSKIFIAPEVLILILNRGKNNMYDVKLNFNQELDITNFVSFRDNGAIYTLYGVVTHLGKSGPDGHFVASVKNDSGKWWRYNDSIVSPINNFLTEVVDFGTPYILFYKKEKNASINNAPAPIPQQNNNINANNNVNYQNNQSNNFNQMNNFQYNPQNMQNINPMNYNNNPILQGQWNNNLNQNNNMFFNPQNFQLQNNMNGVNMSFPNMMNYNPFFPNNMNLNNNMNFNNNMFWNNMAMNDVNQLVVPTINFDFSKPLKEQLCVGEINLQKVTTSDLYPLGNDFTKQKNNISDHIQKKGGKTLGMQNIGATCYMNASVQCVAHIKPLVEYLYARLKTTGFVPGTLSKSLAEVAENLWNLNNPNETYFSPYNLKKTISLLNPQFAGIHADDAKDFISWMYETLHKEMNAGSGENVLIADVDQRNFWLQFNTFYSGNEANNQSIISRLFNCYCVTVTQCLKCNTKLYNPSTEMVQYLPLQDALEYKQKKGNTTNPSDNTVSLYDALKSGLDYKILGGNSMLYCQYCKGKWPCVQYKLFTTCPEVLTIVLNRGKDNMYNVNMQFPEEIDIDEFVLDINNGTKYELIGMVSFFGESGPGGHFIAYCRTDGHSSWYKYNDSIVEESTFDAAQTTGTPYILFYKKIKKIRSNN